MTPRDIDREKFKAELARALSEIESTIPSLAQTIHWRARLASLTGVFRAIYGCGIVYEIPELEKLASLAAQLSEKIASEKRNATQPEASAFLATVSVLREVLEGVQSHATGQGFEEVCGQLRSLLA